jgi:hypothetical protein
MTSNSNNSNSTMQMASWPPVTLTLDTELLLAECENLEVAGGLLLQDSDVSFAVLQMAYLLYQQDWNAARHLWRRCRDNPVAFAALQPWWKVGAAALAGHCLGVWQALRELADAMAVQEDTHEHWTTYVTEIGAEYRHTLTQGMHLLQQVQQQQKLPSHAVAVLGFSNETELRQYLEQQQQHQLQQQEQSFTSIRTDHVAFLESRMDL